MTRTSLAVVRSRYVMTSNRSLTQLLVRLFLTLPGVCFYALLVYVASASTRNDGYDALDVLSHIVLIPGLIPLLCWMAAILLSDSRTIGRLLLVAVLSTAFHYVLFAVGAHGERTTYWLLQALEFLFLVPVVVVLRKRRMMALSSS